MKRKDFSPEMMLREYTNMCPIVLYLSNAESNNDSIYRRHGVLDSYLAKEPIIISKELFNSTISYYNLMSEIGESIRPYLGWITYNSPLYRNIITEPDFERWNYMVKILGALGEYTAQRNGCILNLGCGVGGDNIAMAMMGAKVIGVDAAINALLQARWLAQITGFISNIHLVNADITEFLEDLAKSHVHKYDAVVFNFSLSGTKNEHKAINLASSLLTKGGYLSILESSSKRISPDRYIDGRCALIQVREIDRQKFYVTKTYFQHNDKLRYIDSICLENGLALIQDDTSKLFYHSDYFNETIAHKGEENSSTIRINSKELAILIEQNRLQMSKKIEKSIESAPSSVRRLYIHS